MIKYLVVVLSALGFIFSLNASAEVVTVEISSSGGGCTVEWSAPTLREDGSPLAASEIAKYIIYAGRSAGEYQHRVDVTDGISTTCKALQISEAGEYFFAGQTVDVGGEVSVMSNVISKSVSLSPPSAIILRFSNAEIKVQ